MARFAEFAFHTRVNRVSCYPPPATAATPAPAASLRYPPRRCGSLHSTCSGSRWTTYLAGPLALGCDLREPRGTLLWRLPGHLLLSNGGRSRWVPFLRFRDLRCTLLSQSRRAS